MALVFHEITYTTHKKVIDIGPIQATTETKKTIPLPPVLGGLALVGGIVLFRRGEPHFHAFDLLCCQGDDLRHLPLIERKLRLRSVVLQRGERMLYCDHV